MKVKECESLETLTNKIEDWEVSCPHCLTNISWDLSVQEEEDDNWPILSVWCHECDVQFDL